MKNSPRDNISGVIEIDICADDLVRSLLAIAGEEPVCILDSCGVGHLNSHLLIAGIGPISVVKIENEDPRDSLAKIDACLSADSAAIFTLSYDFGRKLQNVSSRHERSEEPDAVIAIFDNLVVHDYDSGSTKVVGKPGHLESIANRIAPSSLNLDRPFFGPSTHSNISKESYFEKIEIVKERIRDGDTYQANLTRQITSLLPDDLSAETVFWRLRRDHPSPFSAFIQRPGSTVVSASPERFFKIENGRISTSPIKGTRPRGATEMEDEQLRLELSTSPKDRAENTMIVDLLRNDLGRVCEFGSVEVERLCEIEQHPTLFHLVSTISGKLRDGVRPSDILRSLFPCGSITGAPKISTMRIIDEIETAPRGLSMGAIGYRIPASFGIGESIDLSVAIRTMVIEDGTATFNVGGGIVIDSDPAQEWEETVVKSRALLNALGIEV